MQQIASGIQIIFKRMPDVLIYEGLDAVEPREEARYAAAILVGDNIK
jgi:hypothetical protein